MPDADRVRQRILQDPDALARRQVEADRLIARSGAAHLVQEVAGVAANRPWRLDPVPYVLPAAVFDDLAACVAERMSGLEHVLGDVYGRRRVVREEVVPADALTASSRYRLGAVGAPPPPRWLTTYAVDVIALADGGWRLVQDLTDTPTGLGYAFLDRSVMARVVGELLDPDDPDDLGGLVPLSGYAAELRRALASTSEAHSPRLVLLTGGVDDPAYVEHSALARQLGFHLVEGPDLVVRRGRLWLRSLGGLERVDVVYRRLSDAALDPLEIQADVTSGVPGLVHAAAEGGVALANAHGTGVLEDPDLLGHWPAAIEALTGARPRLERLRPGDVAATVPVFRQGSVGTARAVVRLHAVAGPDGITVLAGGNGRVLAPGDDPRRPTAHVTKDVWVAGARRRAPPHVVTHLPQVDLAASVPTRAADALYCACRAAERAEALARTLRVVTARRQQDPVLVAAEGGRWARRTAEMLRALRGHELSAAPVDGHPRTALQGELAEAARALADQLDDLVTEAATVMEYLSVTTSRVLNRLAASCASFREGRAAIDVLDDLLEQLAAFAGLWAESTVRSPAWSFGELGRRVERALVVCVLVHAGQVRPADGGGDPAVPGVVDASLLEVLLAANESLIAYRRRHRSDLEQRPVLDLLVHDPYNPRSLAAAVAQLADRVAAMGWEAGGQAVAALADALPADGSTATLHDVHAAALAFDGLVSDTWFATPVNPVVVHGEVLA